ncbi:MAG: DUF2271 domain-containing protein [Janthinobacterium lividum]
MKLHYTIAFSLPLMGASAMAADLTLKMDIPQLNVAAYHRPYIAVWLEHPDQSFAANLSVLYDVRKKDNAGTKWLKDMRQWWRKSGRELDMPVDGVSGATRAPGEATLSYAGSKALQTLPAGEYQLVVEAAREAGGRDLVRLPFQWPPKSAATVSAKGKEELGAVALQLKP